MQKKSIDIEQLIEQRLKLPVVQNDLYNKFGIKNHIIILDPRFKTIYETWNLSRQKEFLFIVGGPLKANFKEAKRFFNRNVNQTLQ